MVKLVELAALCGILHRGGIEAMQATAILGSHFQGLSARSMAVTTNR